MDNEKNENTKNEEIKKVSPNLEISKEEQKKIDKQYYNDLYNDLPKEVVNILMETHPLMGKEELDAEAAAYRTRHTRKEDIEEIKKARNEQLAKELAREQEEYIKKVQSEELLPEELKKEIVLPKNKSTQAVNKIEEEEDLIQLVKMRPDGNKKKPRPMQEEQGKRQSSQQQLKKRRPNEPSLQEDTRKRKNYVPKEIDFKRKEKESNLDNLYRREDFEEEKLTIPGGSKIALGTIVVGVLVLAFLIFKCVSLSGQLQKANAEIADNKVLRSEYDNIKIEKQALEERLAAYEGGQTPAPSEGQTQSQEGGQTQITEQPETNADIELYTAQEGDTFWTISQRFYGNGSEFTKILEANGLQESDPVKPGQQYKIPKKQ